MTPPGWFIVEGIQSGERRLEDQLRGLDLIMHNCHDATVLDLGSAEGLIARHLCHVGAEMADCIERDVARINVGEHLCKGSSIRFWQGNVKDFPAMHCTDERFLPTYDIVLALSILQKLKRPEILLDYMMTIANEWIALRLPGPVIIDSRSKYRKLNVMEKLHTRFDCRGHMRTFENSWTAIFRRRG